MLKSLKSQITNILFAGLVVFASGCGKNTPPGYSALPSGIYFRLHKIGTDTIFCKAGDYVSCNLVYQTGDDSTFFEAMRTIEISAPEFPGAIDECFLKLAEGDSASFYISADHFFEKTLEAPLPGFMIPGSLMKVSVEILDIKTQKEFEREKEEFLVWISDFGEYEQAILKRYFEEERITVSPNKSGIYPRFVSHGNGLLPAQKDTLVVNYEGRFLNGKVFDSTYDRKEPFQFVLGHEWQVIPGLETGIRMMDEGSKAIFIIPSSLAFGNKGSSTGIIGPFTTVVFEVELIDIKKATPVL
jgi:FKBP-type peptidyl-prolyl cis-trans isomerase